MIMNESDMIEMQIKMQSTIDFTNRVDVHKLRNISGIDLAYWKSSKTGKEMAVCCMVTLNYNTLEVIDKVYSFDEISIPYISSCLAFREIELIIKTYRMSRVKTDLLICDGNGYLHPRHMGLATHAGVILGIPTIGAAKTYCKINGVEYTEPSDICGSFTDIAIGNEVYGRAVRTRKGAKPVFVSIGNKIDIDTAVRVVLNTTTSKSRVCHPVRLADIMTHEMRKNIQNKLGQLV